MRPDQRDDQSLPPYEVLDRILAGYVEQDLTTEDLIDSGFDAETVRRVTRLVDVEGGEAARDVNHLGSEVGSADEVTEIEARLSASGLETTGVEDTICCFAGKTETWVVDPDGRRWEVYVKTSDHETQLENIVLSSPAAPCCG